jgi:predicted nucleotidyltransferase
MGTPDNRFNELLAKLRLMLPMLRTQYHVRTLEVFGSFVRGEEREKSDLDLLVTFDENPTLFKFVALENHLSDSLGIRVDLVMKDSLKPYIGKRILEEAQAI